MAKHPRTGRDPFRPYNPAGIPPAPRNFEDFRGRAAQHVPRVDAMVIWNGAINQAIREVGSRESVTREQVIDLLTSLQADVF